MEATAQLLEKADHGEVTTNHVAERAGFSVGTLYRYFSGKASIFEAMVTAEMARQEARIAADLADPGLDTVDGFARVVVRAALRPFDGRARVRRALMLSSSQRRDHMLRFDAMLGRVTDLFVETVRARAVDCRRMPGPAGRHAMLRAVIGAIRPAVMTRPDLIADPDFEAELVRMLACFFSADAVDDGPLREERDCAREP